MAITIDDNTFNLLVKAMNDEITFREVMNELDMSWDDVWRFARENGLEREIQELIQQEHGY